MKVKVLVAQSYLTVCNPMVCSPPDFSVHGIFQARIQELVAIPFPGDLPDSGIKPSSLALQANSLQSVPPGKFFLWLKFFYGSFYGLFSIPLGTPLQYSCLENPMDGGAW